VLKIHQIFIIKFLILFVGTLLLASLIGYITLKSTIINHNEKNLQNSISLIELEIENIENLQDYATNVSQATELRVTIIGENGKIIADSLADESTMDNHSLRYEILHADSDSFAHAIRYSKTLKVDFLYVAKAVKYRDSLIYIRLSISLDAIMSEFYSLYSKLFLLFLIVVILAFYISKRMSEKVLLDIAQITNYLDEISSKNYKAVIKINYFYEFLQISLMLKNLVKKLHSREKQKRKYTAKLRLINKQRSDMLSAISHEFKNPIAAIIGYAQTLQDDENIDSKMRQKFLGKINSNADKITQMIDRLTISIKLDNDDLKIQKSYFDLKELCQEVVSNLLLKYKDREIFLDVKSVTVEADKTMIELALINLIDNALKYSSDEVKVVLVDNTLQVVDKGIGIQEKHLDKITSKFYRVNKNSWDNSMGIGLAMVEYILKLHRSRLIIESKFTKGSIFSFSIKEMLKK